MRDLNISTLSLDQIVVSAGRELNMEAVASMADSIKTNGLLTPINVVANDEGEYRIIAGRHRLAAMRSLGRDKIDALVHRDISELELRLAEIAENLHRAELTVLQRCEQIAEYAELVKKRRKEGGAQVGQHLSNVKGASGRERGDSAAAHELGLTRQEIQRANQMSSLSPEAKAAAKKAGLDDNQSALLKAAEAPADQQQAVIAEIASAKAAKKGGKRRSDKKVRSVDETVKAILRDFSASDVQLIIAGLNMAALPAVGEPRPISDGSITLPELPAVAAPPADVGLSSSEPAIEAVVQSGQVDEPDSDPDDEFEEFFKALDELPIDHESVLAPVEDIEQEDVTELVIDQAA